MPPPPVKEQQDASKLTAQLISDHESGTYDNQNLTASTSDENAFLARNGATVTLTNSTLSKTGDSSDVDASNFSGQNAVFLSSNSIATLSNLKLESNADGANAIFSTGEKSVVHVNHVIIHTKNNSSRGLDATYGGTIHAKDVEITTEGAHCGALPRTAAKAMSSSKMRKSSPLAKAAPASTQRAISSSPIAPVKPWAVKLLSSKAKTRLLSTTLISPGM